VAARSTLALLASMFSFECGVGAAAVTVEQHGVAVVRGVVDDDSCARVLEAVGVHHVDAASDAASDGPGARWFSQRYPSRDDLLLPLGLHGLRDALAVVLQALAQPLEELLGAEATVTGHARMTEFPLPRPPPPPPPPSPIRSLLPGHPIAPSCGERRGAR
jgi:hypothetical protein